MGIHNYTDSQLNVFNTDTFRNIQKQEFELWKSKNWIIRSNEYNRYIFNNQLRNKTSILYKEYKDYTCDYFRYFCTRLEAEYYLINLDNPLNHRCIICGKIIFFDSTKTNNITRFFSNEILTCSKECNYKRISQTRKSYDDEKKKEIKEKQKQTNLKHWGVEYNFQSKDTKEKSKKTCLLKYGINCASKSSIVKEKIKKTIKENKDKNPNYLKEKDQKSKITRDIKYGDSNYHNGDKISKSLLARTKEQKLKTQEQRKIVYTEKIKEFEKLNNSTQVLTLIKKYGEGWYKAINNNILDISLVYSSFGAVFIDNKNIPKIENYVNKNLWVGTSHLEKDILNFIKDIYNREVIENTKKIIYPYELDIYLPDIHLAIEINGSFWHSKEVKSKNYHFIKSKLCEDKGIRLIHIYECEWFTMKDKITSLLKLAIDKSLYTRIYARNCEVRKINNKIAKSFNNTNHLQGHRNALITYGLYYNNQLVQLMSFSHHFKYQWEIIRGCPGSNNQVIGGVSKLFTHFLKDYNPDSVFSYCDFNKFDGKSYSALGMEFIGYTGPDKFYVMFDGTKQLRNPHKRKELTQNCLFIIYGAGSKKYLWRK